MPTRINRRKTYQNNLARRHVWHPNYEQCVRCGQTKYRHFSNGLCVRCHIETVLEAVPRLSEASVIDDKKAKLRLPQETLEKLRYLRRLFGGASSSTIISLSIDLLYDVAGPIVGKAELDPQGFIDMLSNMRLAIIKSGLQQRKHEIEQILLEKPVEPIKFVPYSSGTPIGGRVHGMLKNG